MDRTEKRFVLPFADARAASDKEELGQEEYWLPPEELEKGKRRLRGLLALDLASTAGSGARRGSFQASRTLGAGFGGRFSSAVHILCLELIRGKPGENTDS
jgi:hypothetical protein